MTAASPPAEPDDLTDRDYEALARFRHALRVFLRFSEDAARQDGLTPNQHQLLLAVRAATGAAPTVGELADALQLRPHSTVELVQRAEAAGLVRRSPDPDDRRRHRVALTDAGRGRLARLTVLHRAELRRFRTQLADLLDVLGDDP